MVQEKGPMALAPLDGDSFTTALHLPAVTVA
jgi:hypothetical protein